jgi:hypothetical protein
VDSQLVGLLITGGVAVPYVVEILRQVPLLTRMVSALPPEVRAGLPRHPRQARLALFGSARFFVALFRYALRNDPEDSREILALKRQVRASAIREAVFGAALAIVVVALWRSGWRPL